MEASLAVPSATSQRRIPVKLLEENRRIIAGSIPGSDYYLVGGRAFYAQQEVHDLLDARGIPNEFHLYPGGHDWSYFAEHLPASLEFHSRLFH